MSKTKKWIRSFEVKIIEDNGTGKDRAKVVYHVCSSLYPDGMPEASTKLVTKKGLSDFKKLNQNLNHLHKSLHLSGHLPSISGRRQSLFFKKKIGKDDTTEEEVLRRQCLDLLESASQHPELYNSQVFLNFFATISSPTSSLEENFPDILDAGQANQKVLANHPPQEEEPTPIGNVQLLIDFMTVLYTRWRFDNYTKDQKPNFTYQNFFFLKIPRNARNFVYS